MKTLRDGLNIVIFFVLVAFIANSLFRLAVFFLHSGSTP